jgi:hypothetical protein
MGDGTKRHFAELLKSAKLPERSVPVCLRGDLRAEYEEMQRQLKQARQQNAHSKEDGDTSQLTERIEAIQAEMQDSTYPFILRALPKPKWRRLVNEHQPRKGENDQVIESDSMGFNVDTFYPAAIRACTVDPVLDEDEWRELLGDTDGERERREAEGLPVEEGKLTDRQFSELGLAAFLLNAGEISVPFSPAGLVESPDSDSE